MAGKYRRSASVGWYWRSSPSYLGSAGGAHGLTGDGGGLSRPSAIPIVANNCVAPMKEIFTRISRISQERFINHIKGSRTEVSSADATGIEASHIARVPIRATGFTASPSVGLAPSYKLMRPRRASYHLLETVALGV